MYQNFDDYWEHEGQSYCQSKEAARNTWNAAVASLSSSANAEPQADDVQFPSTMQEGS